MCDVYFINDQNNITFYHIHDKGILCLTSRYVNRRKHGDLQPLQQQLLHWCFMAAFINMSRKTTYKKTVSDM